MTGIKEQLLQQRAAVRAALETLQARRAVTNRCSVVSRTQLRIYRFILCPGMPNVCWGPCWRVRGRERGPSLLAAAAQCVKQLFLQTAVRKLSRLTSWNTLGGDLLIIVHVLHCGTAVTRTARRCSSTTRCRMPSGPGSLTTRRRWRGRAVSSDTNV